jgi:uncharacterized protein (TIGR02996 family)
MTAADEERALLKAVCDQPDDDTPRLVYADWLTEHDQPERAEFIRVQCALAHIEGDDPRRPALARREAELLAAHQPEWTQSLPNRVHDPVLRRGFVTCVNLSSQDILTRRGAALFVAHPITSVWLSGEERGLRAVTRSPHLSRVRDLGVFDAHAEGLVAVLKSQFATGLRGLYLQGTSRLGRYSRFGDYLPLIDGPHAGGLTRLGLTFAGVNADEVKRFARLPLLSNLTELTLFSRAVGDTAVRVLAGTRAAAGLRILRLRADRLTDAGARHLAESPHLGNLRRLTLFAARKVTADGFAALAASPHLWNLTDLDLRYTAVTTDDVRTLLALPRLARLVLNGTPAGDPQAQFDHGAWNTCPPDHGLGVAWASELRAG